jgi:hypothetical protein
MAEKFIQVRIEGLNAALSTLQALGARAPYAASVLLKDFVDTMVVTPVKEEYVPVDTGALRASIQASEPEISGTKISVTVSAGGSAAPYALSVHENPRSGKTQGVSPTGRKYTHWAQTGQWKYLEIPALAAARGGQSWLQSEARRLLEMLKG